MTEPENMTTIEHYAGLIYAGELAKVKVPRAGEGVKGRKNFEAHCENVAAHSVAAARVLMREVNKSKG